MRRFRFWAIIGVLVVLGAVLVTQLRVGSDRALDPTSAGHSGSKALASVLGQYGVAVRTSTDLGSVHGRVVVTEPDAYSAEQLRELDAHADLVLMAPSARVLAALALPLGVTGERSGATAPLCGWAGAIAAATVDLPDGTLAYDGGQTCYAGALARGDRWVVLGSASLLRNDTVSRTGVAALDVNAITDDRTIGEVTWLLTGTAAQAAAAPTVWALFPDGARRAFIWLAALGGLLVLWRARRFGPVVTEPLPVVVRSAEVVEGHGRLYLRAGARERAAAALRSGAVQRLAVHLGLPRGAPVSDVVGASARSAGRSPTLVGALLGGITPRDDSGLIELATALDELEAAAGVPVAPPKGLNL
ncbi:MAG: DUF4350 domain-containing protein [Jatrophihabitantaceae bacterium]